MWEIDSAVRATFTGMYDFDFTGRRISEQNDILDACKYLYDDQAVLFKKRHNAQRRAIYDDEGIRVKDNSLEVLAKRIWEYFNLEPNTSNTQANFDAFHESLCDAFQRDLTYARSLGGLDPASYGNAQKMVNMLFKYLTCFEDYSTYADLFSFCHIPIDNYILRNAFLASGVPGVTSVPNDMQYNGQGWYELDKEPYLSLLDSYRATLAPLKPTDLSFLSIDYFWWRGIRPLPSSGTVATPIAKFYK